MGTKRRCKHGYAVCSVCAVITDDAKRMCDRINLLVISHPWDTICNSCVAFKLEDGNSDGVLYDTWADARDHQLDPRRVAIFFMRNAMGGANYRDCQIFLDLHRHVYEQGGDFTEPAASSMILSTRGHDIMRGRVNPYDN